MCFIGSKMGGSRAYKFQLFQKNTLVCCVYAFFVVPLHPNYKLGKYRYKLTRSIE